MFNWYKKEKPFTGFAGFGGGATGLGFGGGAAAVEATGGVINEYTDGSTKYRAHIFTTPGTFELVSGDVDLEYMVIGGGGSGGCYNGGAGGSGSVTSNHPDMPAPLRGAALPISGPVSYIVTVGRGGAHSNGVDGVGGSSYGNPVGNPANVYPFAQAAHESQGRLGENSSLGPNIVARGGGGGAGYNPGTKAVRGPGGSGGGGSYGSSGGTGDAYTSNPAPVGPGAGNAGGIGYPSPQYLGGGGGGAGGAGDPGDPGTGDNGWGGLGLRIRIAGGDNPTYTAAGRLGPDSTYQWYAGGGGGGRYNDGPTSGGGPSSPPIGWAGAGRGGGPTNVDGSNAIQGTGSGGGGGGDTASLGGAGGSGIVVVRYEIPSTKTAKATGGNVSFYNGKTIHTFLQPGTFTVGGTTITDAEIVIVGGGGGSGGDSTGGIYGTGGGGAGEVLISTTLQTLPSSTPYGVTVGQGGAGGQSYPGRNAGDQGESSSFGSVTASGGGGGGGGGAGTTGGSGGGGTQYASSAGGAAGTKTAPADYTSYMTAGGAGIQADGAGGGGGAGTSGRDAYPGAGSGGLGIQLPTTFRDPSQSIGMPGPDGSKFWIGGGGGGARYADQSNPGTNGGTGPARDTGGPFSGGGNSGVGPVPGTYYGNQGAEGWANTGGGAGGTQTSAAGASTYPGAPGSRGGSGIVLIAYPT